VLEAVEEVELLEVVVVAVVVVVFLRGVGMTTGTTGSSCKLQVPLERTYPSKQAHFSPTA
jgi:hypothetical protein